jgi:hypothetical protein
VDVDAYIASESERQSATPDEVFGMKKAWEYIRDVTFLTEFDLINMVFLINGSHGYRRVPAVFNQGAPAIDAQSVPRAMAALVDAINDLLGDGIHPDTANELTKEFLLIHPFADGNGRVGSLLWNWLNNTLDNPEPMPYYFGENKETE